MNFFQSVVFRLSRIGIRKEKQYFIENFAVLIDSGVDIVSTLKALRADIRSKLMKEYITNMLCDVEDGASLIHALEKTQLFSPYVLSLIRIGEESGKLPENLQIIVKQEEKNRFFYSKIQSALLYPLTVFIVMLVVGLGVTWFVLPRITSVFSSMQMEIPLITQIIISIADFMRYYGFIAIPLFLLFVFLFLYFVFIYKKTKHIGESIMFRISLSRKLINNVEIARFSYIFSVLVEAGISISEVILSLQQATRTKKYYNFYTFFYESILAGDSVKKVFENYSDIENLFPITVRQMIIAGEKSGKMTSTLKKISLIYEQKIDSSLKNLTSVLEPILLVIVWIGVIILALGIVLPIYGLLRGI